MFAGNSRVRFCNIALAIFIQITHTDYMAKKFVVWFKDVDREDIGIVGGKGANLGEMTKAGFPVPNGFIVTAQAYFHFLDEAKLRDDLAELLRGLNVNNSKELEHASVEIQRRITRSQFPKDIATEVMRAYFHLERGLLKHPLVAVRSSATAEDLPTASFAGQQATFLNVEGEANLLEKVKEAWASLFTARAIFYRATNKFDHFKVGIAIPVQRMVQSQYSGVMFTLDPVTNDKSKVVVDAIYGLGEMIVQGAVTPDHYVVDKASEKILEKDINTQEKIMTRKGVKTSISIIPKAKGSKAKLTDSQILEVARLGKKLEKHYFFPQDVEWAIDDNRVYIVQTRPVTTTGNKQTTASQSISSTHEVYLKGDAASPGIASGPVQILYSPKDLGKVRQGDILVAQMTNPDFVPAMKKAVAIVTERGGRTSHAAIVSRELGIPAVVGTTNAMKTLKDGVVITVNGSTGEIYKGAVSISAPKPMSIRPGERVKTATKVYMNLAQAGRAREVSKFDADGVGLLRAEFIMASVGIHPKKIIADKKQQMFIDLVAGQIATITEAFSPRPVIYRTTDFKTNEYRNLKGGAAFEPEEPNPMLGFRGAARYIANPEVFELELEAIKTVRNKMGHKNLWIMIPFVRTPHELAEVKKMVAASGLARSSTFKLWMMVEIPTNVIRIEDFLEVGIDGVSIGSNDLTMLTMGTDRDNSEVAHDFSEQDPSVMWAFEKVIKTCAKYNVTTSMCGQAPSDYPELVEKLVSWGITSVSVNPDAVDHVRATVAAAEHRVVSKR